MLQKHRVLSHLEARLFLADLLLTENRTAEAWRTLEPALASHPGDDRVQALAGLIQECLGNSAGAVSYYERAVELDPDNEVYWACYESALNAENPGCALAPGSVAPVAASRQLAGFPEVFPPSGRVRAPGGAPRSLNVGSIAAPQLPGANLPPSGGSLAPVSGGQREDGFVWEVHPQLKLLDQALACHDLETAGRLLDRILAENPHDPQIATWCGMITLRHHHPHWTAGILRPAYERFPAYSPLCRVLATAEYRLGNYAAAVSVLQRAVQLDNTDALSYFLLGCALSKLGEHQAASLYWSEAARLSPQFANLLGGQISANHPIGSQTN